MADGVPEGAPPVKRKRGRPRKADQLAAQVAASADGGIVTPVNGVPATSAVLGVPLLKQEPKPRKSRKKKGEVSGPIGVDTNLVGKTVKGVLEGSFDAGYLLSVRVEDSDTVLRGAVFGPGLILPLSKTNDVAPGVKVVKRGENFTLPLSSPISVLTAPGSTPALAFSAQIPPVPYIPATGTAFLEVPTTATTTVVKALSSPTAVSKPAVVLTDSNSQVSSGQDSGQLYPSTVSQARTTAGP